LRDLRRLAATMSDKQHSDGVEGLSPQAPTWEPRIVLQMLVASDVAAQPRGIMDCVDNDGKPYQSAHMAKLVEHARALVSAGQDGVAASDAPTLPLRNPSNTGSSS
jgi:hypothetical protein